VRRLRGENLPEVFPKQIASLTITRTAAEREAHHALSTKPVPDPLSRGALVGKVSGHDRKWSSGRLGTDSSLPPDYQGFRTASELGRSILAAGQPSSCRPTTDRGCKAAIQGAAPYRRIRRRDQGRAVGDESASRNRKFESTPLQQRVGHEPHGQNRTRSRPEPKVRIQLSPPKSHANPIIAKDLDGRGSLSEPS
jgi:hypothetical protein